MADYRNQILSELRKIENSTCNKACPTIITNENIAYVYGVSIRTMISRIKKNLNQNSNKRLNYERIRQMIAVLGMPTDKIPNAITKKTICKQYEISYKKLRFYIKSSDLLSQEQKMIFDKNNFFFPKQIQEIIIPEMGEPDKPFPTKNI